MTEVEKSYEKCQRGVLRADRIVLLLTLFKQLVPTSQLPLHGDRRNPPRNNFLLSLTAKGIAPSIRGGLIATRGCTTVNVCMLCFAY